MFKKSLLPLALSALTLVAAPAHAQVAGDLAFTAFNADEDGWSMVTFVDLATNQAIYVSSGDRQRARRRSSVARRAVRT